MRRTSSRVLLIVAAFVLFLVPVAAIAAGGFTDVDDDSVFKTDIEWLADAGVTKGCNPPTNDRFCPSSNVTREQMAAFMHRLAIGQVVDAKTAITAETADYATTAGDADLLEGLTADQLQGNTPIAVAASDVGIWMEDWDHTAANRKTNVLSVTLEVPSDGIVIATGFAQVSHLHEMGVTDNIVIDITDDFAGFDPFEGALMRDNWKLPDGNSYQTTTPHRSFVVSPGTHTFTLVAATPEFAVDADVLNVTLSAVFYPNAGG